MAFDILFLCNFNIKSANTIIDHVTGFKKYSKHNIFFFDPVGKSRPYWLNMKCFHVIVIHYSIYTLGEDYLNCFWRKSIADSTAIKVMFIQDEYRTVNAIHKIIKELNINILFTCIPNGEIEKVYPPDKLSGIIKVNNLTGYVPEYLEGKRPDFQRKRPIDVGYRARELGYWYGELAQEKLIIGGKFLSYAEGTDIKCDISSMEQDRIYGKKWVNFLRNCKCTLGTESGANVIDFTGEIEENVKNYCEVHPNATFEDVRDLFFRDVDGKIQINQISPRIFEAIGCGCCLILFEGNYSGILQPDKHYIELRKNFSNISEVIEKIKDDSYIQSMAERAYEDIISSGKYSYKSFVKDVDEQIGKCMVASGKSLTFGDNKHARSFSRNFKIIFKMFWILFSRFIYAFLDIARRITRRIKRLFVSHPFFFREKIRLIFQVLKSL